MKNPKISIIIPVYNVEKYLAKCLDSLVNQTYKNIEILCVNDQSTDDSLSILQQYACKYQNIRQFTPPQKLRQGGARNYAIERATGYYIGLVDSDDFVETDFYEQLVAKCEDGNADMVIGNQYHIYSDDSKKVTQIRTNVPQDVQDKGWEAIMHYILSHGCTMWTNIIKRDIFIDNNILYPENTFYEDNAIGFRIFLSCKNIRFCNTPGYYYRTNPNSTINKKNDYRLFERLPTSNMLIENVKKTGYYDHFKNDIEGYYWLLKYHNTLNATIGKFTDKEYLHRLREMHDEYKNDEIVKRLKQNGILKERLLQIGRKNRIKFNLWLLSPWLFYEVLQCRNFLTMAIYGRPFKKVVH